MTISHYPCYVYNLSPINLCNIFQNRAPPDSSEPLLWPPVKSVQIPLQITWARAKGAALVLHVRMEKWQTHSRRRVVSLVHDTWWNFSDPADCSTLLHVCKTITHTYRVGQGKFPFDDRVIRRRKRTKSSSVNSVDGWIMEVRTFDLLISDVCPAGTYRKGKVANCQLCEGNTVSDRTGVSSCDTSCDPGTQPNSGRTQCGE